MGTDTLFSLVKLSLTELCGCVRVRMRFTTSKFLIESLTINMVFMKYLVREFNVINNLPKVLYMRSARPYLVGYLKAHKIRLKAGNLY